MNASKSNFAEAKMMLSEMAAKLADLALAANGSILNYQFSILNSAFGLSGYIPKNPAIMILNFECSPQRQKLP